MCCNWLFEGELGSGTGGGGGGGREGGGVGSLIHANDDLVVCLRHECLALAACSYGASSSLESHKPRSNR